MNKKILLLIITLITLSLATKAQQGFISNVNFYQNNTKLIISYSLDLDQAPKIENVTAYITINQTKTPLKFTSGDIGTITTSGKKEIQVDLFKQFDNMTADISVQVEGQVEEKYVRKPKKPTIQPARKTRNPIFVVEYIYSPSAPYGATIAYCGRQWGGYLNFKTGKIGASQLEHPTSLAGITIGERVGFSRLDVIAGPVFRVHKLVSFYMGLGYGNYELARKYTSYTSTYFYLGTDRRRGMAYEVGTRITLGKIVSISVGYNGIIGGGTPAFSEFHVGAGFTF